jgi:hypothetical protein
VIVTVPKSLFKNLNILDLGNTLVIEIQKGILLLLLLYSCHIVRKFLNIDTEHNKTSVHRVMKTERRHPYHYTRVQHLQPEDSVHGF